MGKDLQDPGRRKTGRGDAMIYLDSGATSFPKPPEVKQAVAGALENCGNPGRGGYDGAMEAARQVYECRVLAGQLFDCQPEQVVMTGSCTQGINMAVRSLFHPGDRVVISGFEHNAVTRTLEGLGIQSVIAGRKLFDWQDTLDAFKDALDQGVQGAVFTHVSNVFGYILPVNQMAELCREREIPFILDAAQSAGMTDLSLKALGADYIAMPGHKGLLGPMGTGLLLCKKPGKPLVFGGTGTNSESPLMPEFLPERMEAGTLNVPGIAGLAAGIRLILREKPQKIGRREADLAEFAGENMKQRGFSVFRGPHQAGTFSFLPQGDCQDAAAFLASQGIAVRAGLHCAPLAHESAGTLKTGTVRVSFGYGSDYIETKQFLQALSGICGRIS